MHPGQGADSGFEVVVESLGAAVVVAHFARVESQIQDMVSVEAHVGVLGANEAAHEESRDDQEH